MSKADQFWLYAREAVLFAGDAETDQEKQTRFDLARIWTQAALSDRASFSHHNSQPETRAPGRMN
jgi:hypothetical protein